MTEEESTLDFFLGLASGYLVARYVAKDAEPVYFGEIRLHHFLVGLLTLFAETEFIRGFLLGVALDDIADLIDVLFPDDPNVKSITDSIREFQGKKKHHS